MSYVYLGLSGFRAWARLEITPATIMYSHDLEIKEEIEFTTIVVKDVLWCVAPPWHTPAVPLFRAYLQEALFLALGLILYYG